MAVIAIPSRQPCRSDLARPEPEAIPAGLDAWPPEQLWLSDGCWLRCVHGRMEQAVTSAVDAVRTASDSIVPEQELLLVLRWTRQPAAALRLSARILRGPLARASDRGRDLAATALLLAATRHDDLLATIEFCTEATGRAVLLGGALPGNRSALPLGFRSAEQLASRMRRRAHEVLTYRRSWPDLDTIGSCLERALLDDPLRRPEHLKGQGPV
jgi:hypothetical protein